MTTLSSRRQTTRLETARQARELSQMLEHLADQLDPARPPSGAFVPISEFAASIGHRFLQLHTQMTALATLDDLGATTPRLDTGT